MRPPPLSEIREQLSQAAALAGKCAARAHGVAFDALAGDLYALQTRLERLAAALDGRKRRRGAE